MATFLGFPVAAGGLANADLSGLNAKRPLYARLFDRFNPGGDMSDDDKQALFRQGLLGLAAGMASTGGQGTAGAIGNGLQSGLLAMNQGRQDLADRQQRERYYARTGGDPAGMREFNELTRIASDPKESEERRNAAKVKLGLSGRASSAGMGFETWTGADGIPRPARNNPRTGDYEVYYDESGQWIPLGSAPGGAPTVEYAAGGEQVSIGADVPASIRDAILSDPQTWATAPHVRLPDRDVLPRAPSGLGRGRSKEAEAAAVAAAQSNATNASNLAYLPAELDLRANAAVDQAARTAQAGADIERETAATTKRLDAMNTLDLVAEAEKLLPGATGSAIGRVRDLGAGAVGVATEGAQATASLQTIAGQLIGKMPRFEGPQSDKDVQLYRQMAGDLANSWLPVDSRMAALRTIRSLNEKAAEQQGSRAPATPTDADARRRELLDRY